MRPARTLVVIALLLGIALPVGAALAQADHPDSWAVTGVSADDALNIRDVPSADSRTLGRIPPNAHGLKNLGCRRNEPSFEKWVKMSEEQRRDARLLWCRIEYHGTTGWVAGRFLRKDDQPKR